MSESKDLARRFYEEVFNAGDLDRVDELLTEGGRGGRRLVPIYREASTGELGRADTPARATFVGCSR